MSSGDANRMGPGGPRVGGLLRTLRRVQADAVRATRVQTDADRARIAAAEAKSERRAQRAQTQDLM